ncbi:MAG: LytTR family transcriptional regulator DNA-binding domain-containing protein [Bacteroidota bacterium]
MINKLRKQRYPIPVSGLDGLIYSLSIGAFIAFFLWFFEPFNIKNNGYSDGQILFFGVITFAVFAVAHNLLPSIFPNLYREERWTVFKQILFYLVLLFFIATLNGMYINYLKDLPFIWENYFYIIIRTIPLGAIPISIYVLLSFYWKYSKIYESASLINERVPRKQQLSDTLTYTITSQLKGESFEVNTTTFLYAKSSGNYIEVVTEGHKASVYRMSLIHLEQQLADNPNLLRCHRSYLVNIQKVTKTTGNAQGLKLWFGDGPTFAPASRKYIEAIKAQLQT